MRAFIVAMALLAVAAAQKQVSSTASPTYDNFGFPVKNRYNQYNQYNQYNRNNRYQNKFYPYNQQQGQYLGQYDGQYQPLEYQNRYQAPIYKPVVFSTAAAPVVTAAPPAASGEVPAVAPSAVPAAAPSAVPAVLAPAPVIAAKVVSSDRAASIVQFDNEINPDGSFSYRFETDNGIAAQEQGVPRNLGGDPPVSPNVVQGSFSWTSPEGEVISMTYVADENGYQPQGNAIPVSAQIPPQILRALQYTAKYLKVDQKE